MTLASEVKCAECNRYFSDHEGALELRQCLRKLSKKVREGLVAVPYPFDKHYKGAGGD